MKHLPNPPQPSKRQGYLYGYARASWDPKDYQGSIGYQCEEALPEYAKSEGLQFRRIFPDNHTSSTVPLDQRPEGRKLLDLLMPGDSVVVTRLDRIFRSTLEFLTYDKLWAERGIYAYCIKDDQEFGAAHQSASAKAMMKIRAVIAEMEREQISERTLEGHARNRKLGRRNGRDPGIGFLWKKRGDGKFYRAANEPERELCRRFLKWHEDGLSLRGIVAHLEDHGANKRAFQRKTSKGNTVWVDGEWNHNTVNIAIDLACLERSEGKWLHQSELKCLKNP